MGCNTRFSQDHISLNFSTWFSNTLGNSSTIKLGKIAMKTPQPVSCEILGVCSKEGSAGRPSDLYVLQHNFAT